MNWQSPPHTLPSLGHGIHLWWLGPVSAAMQQNEIALLSADELQRADRFCIPTKREEFIFYRAAQRRILGRYLQIMPDQLSFCYGDHGKPSIHGFEIGFNLSHSGNYALLGVAKFDIGVDLEEVRPRPTQRLAERFFSPIEKQQIESATEPECAFHQVWTAKEAVLKGHGTGLTTPLSSFSVPVGRAGISQIGDVAYEIQPIQLTTGFHAAVAWEHTEVTPTFTCYRLLDD